MTRAEYWYRSLRLDLLLLTLRLRLLLWDVRHGYPFGWHWFRVGAAYVRYGYAMAVIEVKHTAKLMLIYATGGGV